MRATLMSLRLSGCCLHVFYQWYFCCRAGAHKASPSQESVGASQGDDEMSDSQFGESGPARSLCPITMLFQKEFGQALPCCLGCLSCDMCIQHYTFAFISLLLLARLPACSYNLECLNPYAPTQQTCVLHPAGVNLYVRAAVQTLAAAAAYHINCTLGNH